MRTRDIKPNHTYVTKDRAARRFLSICKPFTLWTAPVLAFLNLPDKAWARVHGTDLGAILDPRHKPQTRHAPLKVALGVWERAAGTYASVGGVLVPAVVSPRVLMPLADYEAQAQREQSAIAMHDKMAKERADHSEQVTAKHAQNWQDYKNLMQVLPDFVDDANAFNYDLYHGTLQVPFTVLSELVSLVSTHPNQEIDNDSTNGTEYDTYDRRTINGFDARIIKIKHHRNPRKRPKRTAPDVQREIT